MVVILCVGVLQLVSMSVGGGTALGQGSPSPSGSEFRIQFLNPSAGTSRELSTKNDGQNTTYHLVAWVNKLPPDATVERKYKADGANNEVSLGTGTLVGSDTFELHTGLNGVPNETADEDTYNPATGVTRGNTGTLKAVLFSGPGEVARDEEAVRVNQANPPGCPPPT